MKLHCIDHDKRVMVLPSTKTIHRSNGEECNSRLEIGTFTGTAPEVILRIADPDKPNYLLRCLSGER